MSSLSPSTTQGPSGVLTMGTTLTKDPLTMEQLNTLIDRIDFEVLTLRRFPESPTLLATISRLAVLRQDLMTFRLKLSATPPEMTFAETGISKQDADTFLASLGRATASSTYPVLGSNTGFSSAPSGVNASLFTSFSSLLENQELQKVFQGIQFIKWKFELDYDPKLHEKFFLLDRLENLEKRILSYSSAGVPVPAEVRELAKKELQLINQQIGKAAAETFAPPPPTMPLGESTRIPTYTTSVRDPRVYDTDVFVRPGSILSDDQIANRANFANYWKMQAGSLDYKKRVDHLCSQIQSAGLGNPAEFGCITDPTTVSRDYSWKGNWDMVCSRVGNTWGAWYPEMFGCSRPNPDDKYDGTLL